uniref:Uncharacterized protein n=1 Tax=Cucumis melo TaxID=3656 RepID=A0A9I9EHS2_CUCME
MFPQKQNHAQQAGFSPNTCCPKRGQLNTVKNFIFYILRIKQLKSNPSHELNSLAQYKGQDKININSRIS